MKILLSLGLILVTFFAYYADSFYLFCATFESGNTALVTIRAAHPFEFDQKNELGGRRNKALEQYVPLYVYSPQTAKTSLKKVDKLIDAIKFLQPWKRNYGEKLSAFLKKEFDVEIPAEVATRLLLHQDVTNILKGIYTIEEALLQKKIVGDSIPLEGKKKLDILYSYPDRTISHLIDDVATIEDIRVTLKKKVTDVYYQIDKQLLDTLVNVIQVTLEPNLTYSSDENKRRIDAIIQRFPSTVVHYQSGDIIVPFHKTLTEEDLILLTAYKESEQPFFLRNVLLIFAILTCVVICFNVMVSRVISKNGWRTTVPYALHLLLLIVTVLLLKSILLLSSLPIYFLPIGFLPILLTLLNQEYVFVLWTTLVSMILLSVTCGYSLTLLLYSFLGSIIAIIASLNIQKRLHVLLPSMLIGVANVSFIMLQLIEYETIESLVNHKESIWIALPAMLRSSDSLSPILFSFIGGMLSGPLAVALLPLFELSWQTASTFKLNRIVDLQHPLMKELLLQAPGTYQHTMTVAYLAQAAGEAVGANTLLLRAGAYYHDIGKKLNPKFFIENQLNGVNCHDTMDPLESAEIIIEHVENGKKIARQAGLPQSVIDLIAQHHGTQLVEYFYNKAQESDSVLKVGQRAYRYTGPKPQSIEAAILLIADAVEAASRSIDEPTRKKLEKMICFIIKKKIAERQLSECNLTTADLTKIERIFTDSLEATLHSRVAYPWQKKRKPKKAVVKKHTTISQKQLPKKVIQMEKKRL